MKLNLLSILACPVCGGDLKFAVLEAYPRHDAEIEDAVLACKLCAREYPVTGGVPRLRPPSPVARATAKTREAFGWEWLRYPGSLPGDKETFLEETLLAPHEFEGKLVLDAGCGMGRYSAVALSLGAEVVAVDMSESLIRVAELAKNQPKLHPVEADLLHPPFKKGIFDVAYSQGVLHHTADTHAAFKAVSALIKPRGLLSVWLYGRPGDTPTSRRTRLSPAATGSRATAAWRGGSSFCATFSATSSGRSRRACPSLSSTRFATR